VAAAPFSPVYGNVGQLGDGTVAPHSAWTPVPLAGGLSFISVSTINFHSCGVTAEGAAYCWGSNRFGGLGDGTTPDAASPVAVVGGFSFASVSVGFAHTCGLTMVVGAAYCWGHNNAGQFGNGATIDVPNPVPVQGQYRFTVLSAGGDDTCGVTTSGVALCWGSGYAGELGDGTGLPRTTPTPVAGGLRFASISAGLGHTCGVTTSGALYCWGSNVHGEIGDGTTTNRSAPVVSHTVTPAQRLSHQAEAPKGP
jgi:alpha-tubulin suppressor-like RCC1 family protein